MHLNFEFNFPTSVTCGGNLSSVEREWKIEYLSHSHSELRIRSDLNKFNVTLHICSKATYDIKTLQNRKEKKFPQVLIIFILEIGKILWSGTYLLFHRN